MASGMRQLPGTLRFQVVQESHTSGLTPAARLWVAGFVRNPMICESRCGPFFPIDLASNDLDLNRAGDVNPLICCE